MNGRGFAVTIAFLNYILRQETKRRWLWGNPKRQERMLKYLKFDTRDRLRRRYGTVERIAA